MASLLDLIQQRQSAIQAATPTNYPSATPDAAPAYSPPVNRPESVTDQQAELLDQPYLGRQFSAGVQDVAGSVKNAVAAAATAVGAPKFGQTMLQSAQGNEQEANRLAGSTSMPGSIADVHGPWDFAQYAAGGVTRQLPQLGAMALGSTLGAGLGVPAALGAFGTSMAMNLGQTYGEGMGEAKTQEQKDAVLRNSFIAAPIMGALDSTGFTKIFNLKGPLRQVAAQAIASSLPKHILHSIATEGVTEATQEYIQMAAVKQAMANPDAFGVRPEDVTRLLDAGVLGGLTGGALSPLGHAKGKAEPALDAAGKALSAENVGTALKGAKDYAQETYNKLRGQTTDEATAAGAAPAATGFAGLMEKAGGAINAFTQGFDDTAKESVVKNMKGAYDTLLTEIQKRTGEISSDPRAMGVKAGELANRLNEYLSKTPEHLQKLAQGGEQAQQVTENTWNDLKRGFLENLPPPKEAGQGLLDRLKGLFSSDSGAKPSRMMDSEAQRVYRTLRAIRPEGDDRTMRQLARHWSALLDDNSDAVKAYLNDPEVNAHAQRYFGSTMPELWKELAQKAAPAPRQGVSHTGEMMEQGKFATPEVLGDQTEVAAPPDNEVPHGNQEEAADTSLDAPGTGFDEQGRPQGITPVQKPDLAFLQKALFDPNADPETDPEGYAHAQKQNKVPGSKMAVDLVKREIDPTTGEVLREKVMPRKINQMTVAMAEKQFGTRRASDDAGLSERQQGDRNWQEGIGRVFGEPIRETDKNTGNTIEYSVQPATGHEEKVDGKKVFSTLPRPEGLSTAITPDTVIGGEVRKDASGQPVLDANGRKSFERRTVGQAEGDLTSKQKQAASASATLETMQHKVAELREADADDRTINKVQASMSFKAGIAAANELYNVMPQDPHETNTLARTDVRTEQLQLPKDGSGQIRIENKSSSGVERAELVIKKTRAFVENGLAHDAVELAWAGEPSDRKGFAEAGRKNDASGLPEAIQAELDPHVLVAVQLLPTSVLHKARDAMLEKIAQIEHDRLEPLRTTSEQERSIDDLKMQSADETGPVKEDLAGNYINYNADVKAGKGKTAPSGAQSETLTPDKPEPLPRQFKTKEESDAFLKERKENPPAPRQPSETVGKGPQQDPKAQVTGVAYSETQESKPATFRSDAPAAERAERVRYAERQMGNFLDAVAPEGKAWLRAQGEDLVRRVAQLSQQPTATGDDVRRIIVDVDALLMRAADAAIGDKKVTERIADLGSNSLHLELVNALLRPLVGVSDAEIARARSIIDDQLGKHVEMAIIKPMLLREMGPMAGKVGGVNAFRPGGGEIIGIATMMAGLSRNPGQDLLTTAHHEVMHSVLAMITNGLGVEYTKKLVDAAQAPHIREQVLKSSDNPKYYEQNPEEMMVQAYGMWATGQLRLNTGSKLGVFFRQVKEAVQKVFGQLSGDRLLVEAFAAVQRGEFKDARPLNQEQFTAARREHTGAGLINYDTNSGAASQIDDRKSVVTARREAANEDTNVASLTEQRAKNIVRGMSAEDRDTLSNDRLQMPDKRSILPASMQDSFREWARDFYSPSERETAMSAENQIETERRFLEDAAEGDDPREAAMAKQILERGKAAPEVAAKGPKGPSLSGEAKPARDLGGQVDLTTDEGKQAAITAIEKIAGKLGIKWAAPSDIAGDAGRYNPAEHVITLATTPNGSLGTAFHEALHAIFSAIAPEDKRELALALRRPDILRKLHELLAEHPEALEDMKNDPEEAMAYAFQFWKMGALKLNPAATHWLGKIDAFIKEAYRWLRGQAGADEIFQRVADGLYAQGKDVAAEALFQQERTKPAAIQLMHMAAQGYQQLYDKLNKSMDDRLRQTGISGLNAIARELYARTGEHTDRRGLAQAMPQYTKRFLNEVGEMFGDNEAVAQEALRALAEERPANSPEAAAIAEKVRPFLDKMHAYQKAAGMAGLGKVADYLPMQWSGDKIAGDAEGFAAMLRTHQADIDKLNDELRAESGKSDFTPLTVEGITKMMMGRNVEHAIPTGALLDERGLPTNHHATERVFQFLSNKERAPWVEDNLVGTMVQYVKQSVKRAEYVRRFGEQNERLEKLLASARRDGATDEQLQLVQDSIDNVFGVRYANMNPAVRQVMGVVQVYQNVRLLGLSLLSSQIDPLVIGVRTQDFGEAWNAYKHAVKNLLPHDKTQLEQLSEDLGVIEAKGIADSLADQYGSYAVEGKLKRINDLFFSANGMNGWTRALRSFGTGAALRFIQKHAAEGGEARYLKELGLQDGDVRPRADGTMAVSYEHFRALGLDENEATDRATRVEDAINRFVDESVLHPNAMERPNWAGDPLWGLVWHLKQFMFTTKKIVTDRVWHEWQETGSMKPFMTAAPFVPITAASGLVRDLIQFAGALPADHGFLHYMVQGVTRSGFQGPSVQPTELLTDAIAGNNPLKSSVAGPTINQAAEILQAVGSPNLMQGIGQTLVHGLPGQTIYRRWLGA
jgi:hypothetical protein